MLRLDILGILITLFLIDVFNWKKVLISFFSVIFITLVVLLALDISYTSIFIGGVFTQIKIGGGALKITGFLHVIIALLIGRILAKERFSINLLWPWEFNNSWFIIYYKLGFYNLIFLVLNLIFRW